MLGEEGEGKGGTRVTDSRWVSKELVARIVTSCDSTIAVTVLMAPMLCYQTLYRDLSSNAIPSLRRGVFTNLRTLTSL